MKTLLTTLLIIHLSLLITNAQTFETALRFGSEDSSEEITDMQRDDNGNFYITGTYTGTVDFGGNILTSAGGKDVFVLKTDVDFNVLWATSGGGTGTDESGGLTLDNEGNCYVGGTFEGTATFGSVTNIAVGIFDIFVIKVNNTGNTIWFNSGGSSLDQTAADKLISLSYILSEEKIAAITYCKSNVEFDSFSFSIINHGHLLIDFNKSTGVVSIINEIDDIDDLHYIRSSQLYNSEIKLISGRGNSNYQMVSCIHINGEGHQEIVMKGDIDYVMNDRWNEHTHEIIAKDYPFVYLAGTFYGNITWGNFSITNSGEDNTFDLFLVKLNMEEDSVYWMKRIGGNRDERVYSIDSDSEKNLYITGYYESTCDFGSGVQLTTQDRAGFVAKYDRLGNVQWAKSVGSGTGDRVNSVLVDDDGTAYLGGKFLGTANFDDITLTSEGSSDLFLGKLGCAPARPSKIIGDTLLCVGQFDYSVTNSPSVDYQWSISGGGTITGNTTTNATSVNWDTPGDYNLTVSRSNECGDGIPQTLQVRVKDLPENLTLSGDTLACLGTEAYNVDLENETSYNWTINGGGIIFGIENTAVVNWTTPGTYNMSITPTNMCGVGNMLSQVIYVSSVPEQPNEITGNTEVCNGSESYGIPANSTIDYNWTVSSGGELSFTDNNASVNWNASGIHTLTVTATNRCGVGIPRALNVNVSDVPSQVGSITGSRSVCVGTEEYSVLQAQGVSYEWTLSGGGVISENGNSAEVNWSTPGTYTLGVRPSNQCGNGSIKNISITVNDKPLQPSSIIGVDDVCKGIQTYQTPLSENVNYNWTLSGGGVLTPNNNTVQVDWDTEGTHTLTVVPYNLCGTGASKSLNIEVSASDAQISGITGNDLVCLNNESYTADYVGGLDYNWQLATGGTITSGSTTNTASISWNSTGYHTLILGTSDGCSQSLVVKVDDIPAQTSEISGDNPVCLGESGYFVNHTQNTTYDWTVSEGGTLISSANTVMADWTDTGVHTLSITPANHCGTGLVRTFDVDVKTIPPLASEIIAQDTACIESTTYTIDAVADVNYNWNLENEGGVLIPGTNTSDVVWLYPHYNTVSVSLSNLCGTGALRNKTLVIDDTPELPEISGTTEVCIGEAVYTTALENGHNYNWSINGGGVLTVENDTAKINWTTTGNHILSLTNSNRCGASETKSIIIKVSDIPNQPEAISGNNEVCYGVETYDITAVGGINYSWNLDGGGSISEVNNSVTVNWNTTGTYTLSVTPGNRCGTGQPSIKIINVHTVPAQTDAITGNEAVCLGAEIYSVNQTANTTYNWTLSNGGELNFTDNTATVNWTDKGIYTLNVTPSNFCGSGISRTKIINVNDIPEQAVFNNPETTVCLSETSYSANQIPGADYIWQVSGGGTLTSNSTNTASVNWTTTGMHQLSVTPGNECGQANSTSINIDVYDVPAQPNLISGENVVCLDNEIYTTESTAGVSYTWSLNGGGNITPNANSVFVSWLNQGTYQLSVTPFNFCGNGASQNLEITVNDIPNQPSLIAGNDNPCINTDESYLVTNVADLTYIWSVSEGGTINENANNATVSWTSEGSHTLSVTPENMCGLGAKRNQLIEVKNIPEQAVFNNPETTVCLSETSYSVNQISGADYIWQVSGGGTLTSNSTNTASVDWTTPGDYQLSVTPRNECGQANSTSISVEVYDVPTQPNTITGENIVCLDNEIYTTESTPGVNYAWSLNGGGNITPNANSVFVSWLNQGTYELSVTPYNFCGNGESKSLQVTVNDIPTQPSIISGNDNPCINTDENYDVNNVSGLTYIWSVSEGGTINEDANNATVSWTSAGSHTLSVTPENMCGLGAKRNLTISAVGLPNQLTFLSGSNETCIGTDNYLVNQVFGIDYNWDLSGGGNITENGNSATVDWQQTGNFELSISPENQCGQGVETILNVSVEQIPKKPDLISGATLVCLGENSYSTNFISGVNYIWDLNGGGNLSHTDNTATILWQTKGNYNLSVQAKNRCGSSLAQSLDIETNKTPTDLLSISGETGLCKGTQEIYSATSIPEVDYVWKLNDNTLGETSETLNLNWNNAGNYILSVAPKNICGTGFESEIIIKVNDTLPQISNHITGDTICCYNSNLYYSIDDNNEDLQYLWNIFPNADFNQSFNSIQTDWTIPGSYKISVFGLNNCGVSDTSFIDVIVENEPEIPIIEFRNDTLFSSVEKGNQWYADGLKINDAVKNFYIPNGLGEYSVQVKNTCSESLMSNVLYFVNKNTLPYGIEVYPVPVFDNKLTIKFPVNVTCNKIEVYNSVGILFKSISGTSELYYTLNFNESEKGTFLIKIYTDKGEIIKKVIVL